MKIAAIFIAGALIFGCGSESDKDSNFNALGGVESGVFSGCIDSSLFSPRDCHNTCADEKMAGYLMNANEYCSVRGRFGDIACFCPR